MKKLAIILFFIGALAQFGYAQDNKDFTFRTGLGFVPQYTISGGLRFDIDRSISKKSNQWLVFSPQVYVVNGKHFDHNFTDMWGAGLDIKHKVFLKPGSLKPSGYYVQYGGMFQYFSITENKEYTEAYLENGVEYYGVTKGNVNTRLYKFGGNFHLGYQWMIGDKVFFDIYSGAGIRISHNNRNEGFDTFYNNYWIDYGYSGTLLDGGFRIGFYF